MREFQIPNFEVRRNPKSQAPNSLPSPGFGIWCLEFLWSLRFGAWSSLPRGLSLFLGGFCLLNLLGDFRSPGFDANLWWIDLRVFPHTVADIFLFPGALCLIGYAVRPPRSVWPRILTVACVGTLLIMTAANLVQFYILLARGIIAPAIPIPLSLFISAALTIILAANLSAHHQPAATRLHSLAALAVCLGCLVLFPLAQMFCFGKTDYRRPADVAVVLGARVYADGRPSDAVADRVRTACELYRDGLTKKLLFSGGPGDGAIHETEAMKRMAVHLGVKPQDILLDKAGLNTQATVRNSEPVFAKLHASRILVVSHFYHLPRVKLAYQRRGWDVYSVPARESYLLRQMPYNMAREVAALWVYYLRPLGGAQISSPTRG
jgi:vancomycin permeability regulator SanA